MTRGIEEQRDRRARVTRRGGGHGTLALAMFLIGVLGACARETNRVPGVASTSSGAVEHVVWASPPASSGRYVVGGIAGDANTAWIVWETATGSVLRELRMTDHDGQRSGVTSELAEHPFPGVGTPRLVRFADGEMLLIADAAANARRFEAGERRTPSERGLYAWRLDRDGSARSEPVRMSAADDTPGTPLVTPDKIVVPVLRGAEAGESTLLLHVSADRGATWHETRVSAASDLVSPALAMIRDGGLLLVALRVVATEPSPSGTLVASTSNDAGATWSAWRDLGIAASGAGIALTRAGEAGGLLLAWTDPPPDTTQAPPGLQALRLARSSDGGATWSSARPLVLRPGRVPTTPALLADAKQLLPVFVERTLPGLGGTERIVCLAMQEERPGIDSERARYGIDPAAVRASLRILCAHTLARPEEPRRLFVEGYFMRSLAAAQAVFDSFPDEGDDWFAARACGEHALAWADNLVATQLPMGYWKIGYGGVFIADIASALGVFPALESRADAARLQRWEAAARRFVAALAEDGMSLADGSYGIGWQGSTIPRLPHRAARSPYLVSTALAGVELHAWLAHRSGNVRDREQALRALDWTLAQIRADGALPRGPMMAGSEEGALTAAVYVQEAWMAADRLLAGDDVRRRLRAALPRHVDWILRLQRPDGTWDSGADGEFARTPAIVNFLVWYDRRIESRDDVRAAIHRAGSRLVDPEQWTAVGLFRAGKHYEVLRAHAGRVLAALAQENPVW